MRLTQSPPPSDRNLSEPQKGHRKSDDVGSNVPDHHDVVRVRGHQFVRHFGSYVVSSYPGAEVDYGTYRGGGEGEEDSRNEGLG